MAAYVPLLILFVIAVGLAVGFFVLTTYLGPKAPTADKDKPFECGNPSEGARATRPSVKFYLTALLFVVFDIEVALIYPWAVQFRSLGWVGFATMATFIGLLAVALIYVWRKGALQWEK
jgi:NADH-quinone oxidoreductase subunit A